MGAPEQRLSGMDRSSTHALLSHWFGASQGEHNLAVDAVVNTERVAAGRFI